MNFCRKRLMREYKELVSCPLKNVAACPLDDNIQEWHVNIIPFDESFNGCTFHLIMKFPDEYPNKAPKVTVEHYIEHPNVYGGYLCLDILTISEETIGSPFRGWSCAYNVTSILTQLQSFLFDLEGESFSYKGYQKRNMIKESQQHVCRCGHGSGKTFPPVVCQLNAAKPGVFQTNRKAILRESFTFHSLKVGILPQDTTVVVTEVTGNRCCIDLSTHDGITSKTGFAWCSYRTANGLLLRAVKSTKVVTSTKTLLESLHDVLLQELLQFLDFDTIHRIGALNDDFQRKVEKAHQVKLNSYRCYYTMDTLQQDCVFGFGVNPMRMDKRSRKSGKKKACLQQLHTSFDCMTYEAFDVHKVRHNVWKDVTFSEFLPLYINNKHGKKSLPLAEKCIKNMWKVTDPGRPFSASMILETLCKLMNTTVVNMNKSTEELEAGELKLHDSIKALEGYMSFHHLLLAFVQKYPSIIDIAEKKVCSFISDPLCRDKEVTPDLGELIICISITKYQWKDLCPALIEEVFQRNARWILAKYPNLNQLEEHNKVSCLRLCQSWNATIVGKRLAMFQKFFLDEIANPVWLDTNCKEKCLYVLNHYNKNYGRPSDNLAYRLQSHSRKVLSASCWDDYFTLIGFPTPSAKFLCNWLRNSITISEKRKYHSFGQILRYDENFKCAKTCKLHMNTNNCMCAGGKIFSIKSNAVKEVKTTSNNSLDLVFIIDCTGSMGSWLDASKKHIKSIVKEVKKTSCSEVRFGMVAYRDHCDTWTTKEYKFTDDIDVIQKQIDKLKVDGGGDYPEAMCCALAKASELSWNYDKKAMRVAILISDAPPHGFCGRDRRDLDDHPTGCPCGHDSIKVCHTMKTKGITLYTVDCGDNDDAVRQYLFHAMSGITGGIGLNLNHASSLSKVVVGACLQESSIVDLCNQIRPLYIDISSKCPRATEDQLVQMTYVACKTNKITVKTCLPESNFRGHRKEAIESLMFCTDRKHAQAAIKQNDSWGYFSLIENSDELVLGSYEKPVKEESVRKCIQRIGDCIQEEKFLKDGCDYRGKYYRTVTFTARRRQYGVRKADVENFWKELSVTDYKRWSSVLDKIPTRNEKSVDQTRRVCMNNNKKCVTSITEYSPQRVANWIKNLDCWNKSEFPQIAKEFYQASINGNDLLRMKFTVDDIKSGSLETKKKVLVAIQKLQQEYIKVAGPLKTYNKERLKPFSARTTQRNVGVPVRNVGVPVRNVGVPMRNAGVPMRNAGVPMRNVSVPMRNVGVPMRYVGVPIRNVGVPMRNVGVPMRNVGVPMRNVGGPMRNVGGRNVGVPMCNVGVPMRNVCVNPNPMRNVDVPTRNVGVNPIRNVSPHSDPISCSVQIRNVDDRCSIQHVSVTPPRNVSVPTSVVSVPTSNASIPTSNVSAPTSDVNVPTSTRNVCVRNVPNDPLHEPVYQRNVSVTLDSNPATRPVTVGNSSNVCNSNPVARSVTVGNSSTSSGSTVSTVSKHPLTMKICTTVRDTTIYKECNTGNIVGSIKKRALIKIDAVVYDRAHLCHPIIGWIDVDCIRFSKIPPTLVVRDIPCNVQNQNSLFRYLQKNGWKTNNVKLVHNQYSSIAFCEFKTHEYAQHALKTKIALGHVILSAGWSSSYQEQRRLKLKYNL